jgi:hypothetical protein
LYSCDFSAADEAYRNEKVVLTRLAKVMDGWSTSGGGCGFSDDCCLCLFPVEGWRVHVDRLFKMKDVTFFSMDDHSKIRQMSRLAPNEEIMGAQIGTLTLGNEKNGWKGRALGLRYWRHMTTSFYYTMRQPKT